jgi:hypothetical protein
MTLQLDSPPHPAGKERFQASFLNNMTINPSLEGMSTPLKVREAQLNSDAATAYSFFRRAVESVDQGFIDNRSQSRRGASPRPARPIDYKEYEPYMCAACMGPQTSVGGVA